MAVWRPPRHLARFGMKRGDHPLSGNTDRRHRTAKMESALRQQEQFREKPLKLPDLICSRSEERYTPASSRIRDLLGYRRKIGREKSRGPAGSLAQFPSLYRDVGQATVAASVRSSAPRWQLVTMRAGQPILRLENKLSGVIFGARHYGREETQQQIIQRTPGGHGADDRGSHMSSTTHDDHRWGQRPAA